jgi:hypothetical protein
MVSAVAEVENILVATKKYGGILCIGVNGYGNDKCKAVTVHSGRHDLTCSQGASRLSG